MLGKIEKFGKKKQMIHERIHSPSERVGVFVIFPARCA
jgi:hypothetical protein